MKHSGFVHLHNHTEYSLLDGASKIKPMLQAAAKMKMPALAISDHGNMFGAVDFFFAAMDAGIKPIIGCEVYIAPGSRFEKAGGHGDNYYHLLLLCKNEEGYRNLIKLVSSGYLEGFYYKPRIDKDLLAAHSKGLICLSACLKGEVPNLIINGKVNEAREAAKYYKELFGEGNYYLELQDHKIEDQYKANEELLKFSKELNLPVVATNDCHYIQKAHSKLHDILLCIQTKRNFDDADRMRFPSSEFYLKSEEEMRKIFEFVPEALKNTLEIAEKCNYKMEKGKLILPNYEVPENFTLESYFDHLTIEGMKKRYGVNPPKAIVDRTNYELDVIKRLNFAGYFLIVWDFIKYAKDNGIYVGAGRGSAAGSIVAYCLAITETDPLKYSLFFERFLNPERVSPPDIDIDFEDARRDELIKYVTNKYGKENVSQIITFMTLKRKAAVKAVGRVLNIPFQDVNKLTKMIPSKVNAEEGKDEPPLLEIVKKIKEVDEWMKRDENIRNLIQYANDIEGLKSDVSTHAAGVVISRTALVNYVPLYKEPGEEEIITQFEKNCVEKIGLLKMDFLGLKTLTVIKDCIKNIKKERGLVIDPNNLPLEDAKSFQILCEAKSAGIFQLESAGMKDLLRKMKPQTIFDIIALIALYRPGPMEWIDEFVKRKHGQISIKYEHPDLEDILKETYGIMLYQEQVMQATVKLAGFTMAQADILRKAMSKKDPEAMEKQRLLFIKGAVAKKINEVKAEKIFNEIAKFAGYGFNKSHSASYAIVSYQTAYLKANYPLEYYAALLSSEINNAEKIGVYVDEIRKGGFILQPPCINLCDTKFSVHDNKIFFALSAIKNVGVAATEMFIKEREKNGPFKSLQDFCNRVDLRIANKEVIESLIQSGAFDCFGLKRLQMARMADEAVSAAQANQQVKETGQDFLFENLTEQTQRSYPSDEYPEERLLNFEKQLLGIYLSGHPLVKYEEQIKRFASNTTQSLKDVKEGNTATLGGIISRLDLKTTKRNERMAILALEDLGGIVEVVVFPKLFERINNKIAEETLIIVKGKVDFEDSGSENPEEKGTPKILAEDVILLSEAQERLYKKA
ncbi:MAG: DNA polymerase III subunit alpha, partial [Candidatus Firestonebacteria bacterium]